MNGGDAIYIAKGVVQEGSKRASSLGYPTINIPVIDKVNGIFIGEVITNDNKHKAAVFADPDRAILEAHLLDFGGDLYGQEITITLLKKIRDSQIFENDGMLKHAISEDVERVRDYFTRNLEK